MKVKLIIWDLDDTLWSGTLAEGDKLELSEFRSNAIKKLNNHGIVNSICSKNDFETAEAKLRELDLWEEFVFPRIEFSPKGAIVRWILEAMQLRAENTIFIDDNPMNLNEVKHFVPGITVFDATSDQTDVELRKILEENSHVTKNRIEEYRILEKKLEDKDSSKVESNEEFLRTCKIKITLVRRAENLPHAERIEELINRTNQLNFTKNRIQKDSISNYILDVNTNDTYSVFVWDRYGIYGLAGFFSIEKNTSCPHFLFSCRTMNMGIEQFIYQQFKLERFLNLPELKEMKVDWIEVVDKSDVRFMEVLDKMGKLETVNTHVMANCQSGIISHYLSSDFGTHIDNWPKIFTLSGESKGAVQQSPHPDSKNIVYGAFNDYNDTYWGEPPSSDKVKLCIEDAFSSWHSLNLNVIIILPPEKISDDKFRIDLGVSRNRVKEWNKYFSESSSKYGFKILCIDDFALSEGDIIDVRHYSRTVFERIGLKLNQILLR